MELFGSKDELLSGSWFSGRSLQYCCHACRKLVPMHIEGTAWSFACSSLLLITLTWSSYACSEARYTFMYSFIIMSSYHSSKFYVYLTLEKVQFCIWIGIIVRGCWIQLAGWFCAICAHHTCSKAISTCIHYIFILNHCF